MPNTAKQTQLDTLITFLKENSNFALIKFEKTKHTSLEALRRELKKNNSSIKVIKNSLFLKAINKLADENRDMNNIRMSLKGLKENSAILALGGDWIEGLKAFFEFSKKETSVGFKVGQLDNMLYKTADLEKLAQLPGRGELIAKLLGGLKSPLFHFNNSLKFHQQKFVYILSQKSQQTS